MNKEKLHPANYDTISKIISQFPGTLFLFKVDKEGMFSMPYISEGAAELFGLSLEKIQTIPESFENIHPEYRERFIQSINESMENMSHWLCEYKVIMPSGDFKWVRGESVPELLPDGSIEWCGVLTDITQQKNNETIIKNSNILLESIRDANATYLSEENTDNPFQTLLHTLITITESEFGFIDEVLKDESGERYKLNLAMSDISWDKQSKELYRQLVERKHEFRNLNNLAGLPAKTGEVIIANNIQSDQRSGGVPRGHPTLRTFMGLPLYFHGELVGVAGVANRKRGYDKSTAEWLKPFLYSYAGLIHSVRARKKEQLLHKKMQNNLELIDTLINASPDSFFLLDKNGIVLTGNDVFAQRLGVSLDELTGNSIYRFLPDDIAQTRKKMAEKVIRTGQPLQFEDERAGMIFRHYLYPISGEKGTVSKIAVLGSDITRQTRAEFALKQSEEIFRTAFLNAPVIISICDVEDDRYIDVNDTFVRVTGYSREEAIGKTSVEIGFISAADRGRIKHFLEKNGAVKYPELDLTKADGSEMTCIYSGEIIEMDGEKRLLSIATDITEQKRGEYALRKSELRFRTVADNTYNWETWVDPDGMISYCSPSVERLTGYTPEEIISDPSLLERMVHPEDQSVVASHLCDELTDIKTVYHFDYRILTKTGKKKWVSHYCVPVFDQHKRFIGRRGSTRNITLQKLIEEQLRKNGEKFRTFYNKTPVMLHSIDKNGNLDSVSDYWLEKTGYSRNEVIGNKPYDFLTKDSRAKAKKYIPQLFLVGKINDVHYQFVCKNGDIIDVLLSSVVEYDSDGEVLMALAVINDITQLIKIENELKNASNDIRKKAARLEELNIALKVLLEQRGEEKIQLEKQILEKMNVLIKPYFEKLKREMLPDQTNTLIDIIQSNCDEIFEPLSRDLGVETLGLSSAEMQIIDLIKSGKSTKEIASLLSISESTAYTHRKNIRKKIGLRGEKTNLETFLKKK